MSIKTFSDFPYYMLSDYFSELMKWYNTKKNVSQELITVYDTVTFEEPWLDFHSDDDYLDFGSHYDQKESIISNVRLRGPKTNIVTQGGEYTTMYAKIKNYGYKPIGLRPTIDEEWQNENWFNFEMKEYDSSQIGLFTLEEAQKLVSEIVTEEKKIADQIIKTIKKYVGENVKGLQYCVIDHISSNDSELDEELKKNAGEILPEPINIFKSKSGKTHAFKIWKRKEINEDVQVESEDEIYIRKDSLFYKWFEKNLKYLGDEKTNNGLNLLTDEEKKNSKYFVWNHEYYLNDNILFNYFGCIYKKWPSEKKWKIYHRGMKDFMIEAIPYNDMGIKLKTFTWEIFDRIYQEIYNMQKNMYTLLDPDETYSKFLGYLSLFYGIDLDKLQYINQRNQRWYIKNLPYFLKKKGTWASLWITWQCIIDKNNDIRFYERWHMKEKLQQKTSLDMNTVEVIDV